MAKSDWEVIGFRLPDIQRQKLGQFIEESDEWDNRQDYLHEQVLEDIREVELANPRDELKDIRRQKDELRDEINDIVCELEEMRDRLGELEEQESELQSIVEDHDATSTESYEASVREATEEIINNELIISERWERIQRISEKWQVEPMEVLRDIFEQDPRIDAKTAKPYGSPSVPDDWRTRTGESYEEAVHLVRIYCEERKGDDVGYRSGIYVEDEYVSRVAEEHEVECKVLLREAVSEMDEEFDEIVYSS
ncbi:MULTISPECIES: hypothetical protein [Halorussus]|uniref:hypothetical protein n=1 Tax=Halorussus TaxID=1070314 RepID=UPI000E20F71D|nr:MULTISPECIES: hypothetical protein [Halorussus]NHN60466.1 hypothetical protein [Halorussus sp. JP-T4]